LGVILGVIGPAKRENGREPTATNETERKVQTLVIQRVRVNSCGFPSIRPIISKIPTLSAKQFRRFS
jgi:hypothetical protein